MCDSITSKYFFPGTNLVKLIIFRDPCSDAIIFLIFKYNKIINYKSISFIGNQLEDSVYIHTYVRMYPF
jgi:hypothetical protein